MTRKGVAQIVQLLLLSNMRRCSWTWLCPTVCSEAPAQEQRQLLMSGECTSARWLEWGLDCAYGQGQQIQFYLSSTCNNLRVLNLFVYIIIYHIYHYISYIIYHIYLFDLYIILNYTDVWGLRLSLALQHSHKQDWPKPKRLKTHEVLPVGNAATLRYILDTFEPRFKPLCSC